MRHAFAAESLLIRKRMAPAVVGAVWVALVVLFGFGVPYIVYATFDPATQAADRAALLEILIPSAFHTTAAGSYPLFGGAIMLILGVLVTASEYRWGTWPTRLSQGPGRAQVMIAKVLAGSVVVVVIAAVALVAALLTSVVIALVEGQPIAFAGPLTIVVSLAGTILISVAWLSVGAALGVVFKGAATALAVGLVWTLGLENALSGIAGFVPWLEPIRYVLLGPASGSLVASLGVPTLSEGGSPGVEAYMSAPVACLVLAAYAIAGVAVAVHLIRSRDIT
ncbi:ABC transporter permease subunit [Herbidospora sp. RD11066]